MNRWIAAPCLVAGILLAQDKPPMLPKVVSNTVKLKSYAFKISGGAETIDGEFEKGAIHYRAGGVEAAGKGGVSMGKIADAWLSINSLIQTGQGGASLRRLAQLQPPHTLISMIGSFIQNPKGDGHTGFTGKITDTNAMNLVNQPWIDNEDLKAAGGLEASVSISVGEARVTRVDLRFSGTVIDRIRRHYHGQPDPAQPPPRPPGPNWMLGPDGYWYEGRERRVSAEIKIEISSPDGATIADEELRKKFGLK